MADAPSGSGAAVKKVVGKGKVGAATEGGDGKKRFEVKKVRCQQPTTPGQWNACLCGNSGMQWLCGLGISSSTTVLSAETTSWISVGPKGCPRS